MADCKCESSRNFRATAENAGEKFLYLRCDECGGKVDKVPIDLQDLGEAITLPKEAGSRVSIHFDPNDSPWEFVD